MGQVEMLAVDLDLGKQDPQVGSYLADGAKDKENSDDLQLYNVFSPKRVLPTYHLVLHVKSSSLPVFTSPPRDGLRT